MYTSGGGIEFVEKVLFKAYRIHNIQPINIPMYLFNREFWGRRMTLCTGANSVYQIFETWEVSELFIKSASRLKSDITGIYMSTQKLDSIDTEPLLLVSEVIDIVSEYRVFIHNGKILDIKNYSGDQWVVSDKSKVYMMASALKNNITACTLDAAVTTAGETYIIEVHPFVSCGTYGFEPSLKMYKDDYKQLL